MCYSLVFFCIVYIDYISFVNRHFFLDGNSNTIMSSSIILILEHFVLFPYARIDDISIVNKHFFSDGNSNTIASS